MSRRFVHSFTLTRYGWEAYQETAKAFLLLLGLLAAQSGEFLVLASYLGFFARFGIPTRDYSREY